MAMNYHSVRSNNDITDLEKRYNDYKQNEIKKELHNWKYIFSFSFIISVLLLLLLNRQYLNISKSVDFYGSSNYEAYFSINFYNPKYGVPETIKYVPWNHIVEPYKLNVAELAGLSVNGEDVDLSDYTITWNIDGNLYEGAQVNFQIDRVDIQTCTVSAINTLSTTIRYDYEFKLAIKYIRREIRSLTDDDRNLFLDSLKLLYTTSLDDGKAKYGDKFVTAESFSSRHLNGAARVDCDHWHDGAGIVNHHVAYTLEIEQALQSIDPSLSMPYWEYAMDNLLYSNWQDSPMFQDDWFGNNNPSNHELTTGRWGDIQIPSGDQYKEWSISETNSLNPFVNGRGQLRSPWNNNPSNFIGRSNTTYSRGQDSFPTCKINYMCFRSTSLGSMLNCLNGVTHGPVHIKIGGSWGEGDKFLIDDKLPYNFALVHNIDRVLVFKLLWRTGYTRCPSSCNDNDNCACSIPDEYINTYGPKAILVNSGVWDVFGDSRLAQFSTDEALTKFLRVIEDPDSVGDMFTSAASFDPIFWPLHGQIERILGLKRIQKSINKDLAFIDEWSYLVDDNRVLNGLCEWKDVKDVNDLTLPSCDFTGEKSCWGHNEDDIMEWSNFLGNGETYTNSEFYDFIHPWTDELPYVYDTYGFTYCDYDLYPFET